MAQPSAQVREETRTEQLEERLSEGSVEENIEALRALSPYGEEVRDATQVMLSAKSKIICFP